MTREQKIEKAALMREMSDDDRGIYFPEEWEPYTIEGVGDFDVIAKGPHDSPSRWTTTQHVVYQGPSGSFWQLFWERGNTESQADQFDNAEPVLVRRVERIVSDFVPVKD